MSFYCVFHKLSIGWLKYVIFQSDSTILYLSVYQEGNNRCLSFFTQIACKSTSVVCTVGEATIMLIIF